MTEMDLTQEMIADGMRGAEKVACRLGDPRCYPFPDPVEDARATCTRRGTARLARFSPRAGERRGMCGWTSPRAKVA